MVEAATSQRGPSLSRGQMVIAAILAAAVLSPFLLGGPGALPAEEEDPRALGGARAPRVISRDRASAPGEVTHGGRGRGEDGSTPR
eukprot:CAMPEP_0182887776 /NCGR_PEP_ID=MMETSP0034_2-20130328/21033_1 /TAXON_ID=156128 /ORGANISM="Nephroselmis pyriformis, Strain CCMP717" /LENGTH=85 /DNA_ID=CAMNT_0025021159 /DNA_START=68 /DNA_END=321 /DNA_ORIENTATION=+